MTENAQEQLFREFQPRLRRFFEARGFSSEDALDLTQATFLRAFRSEPELPSSEQRAAWLFTIAHNVRKNEIRDQNTQKRNAPEVPLDEPEDRDKLLASATVAEGASHLASPEALLLAKERQEALEEKINALPPKMRACVFLRIVRGLKIKEIAEILKIKADTVKGYLDEAKVRLRAALGNRFGPIDF